MRIIKRLYEYMWSALFPISNHSHIRQLQFATHAFSQMVLQQAVQISICQCRNLDFYGGDVSTSGGKLSIQVCF